MLTGAAVEPVVDDDPRDSVGPVGVSVGQVYDPPRGQRGLSGRRQAGVDTVRVGAATRTQVLRNNKDMFLLFLFLFIKLKKKNITTILLFNQILVMSVGI